MGRNTVIVLILLAISIGGASYYYLNERRLAQEEAELRGAAEATGSSDFLPVESKTIPTIFTEIKSAHFVSSSPANNEVLAMSPSEIKLNFNFVLANNSTIKVTHDGNALTLPNPTFARDKLSMTVPLSDPRAGSYQVDYAACWPDKSCHEGSFSFTIKP